MVAAAFAPVDAAVVVGVVEAEVDADPDPDPVGVAVHETDVGRSVMANATQS